MVEIRYLDRPFFPDFGLRPVVTNLTEDSITFSYSTIGIMFATIVIAPLPLLGAAATIIIVSVFIKSGRVGYWAIVPAGAAVLFFSVLGYIVLVDLIRAAYYRPFVKLYRTCATVGYSCAPRNKRELLFHNYSVILIRQFAKDMNDDRCVKTSVYLSTPNSTLLIATEHGPDSSFESCGLLCHYIEHDTTKEKKCISQKEIVVDWWWHDRSAASFRQKAVSVSKGGDLLVGRSLFTKVFGYGIFAIAVLMIFIGATIVVDVNRDVFDFEAIIACVIFFSVCAVLGWVGLAIGQGRAGNPDIEIKEQPRLVRIVSYLLFRTNVAILPFRDIAAVQLIVDENDQAKEVTLIIFDSSDRIGILKGVDPSQLDHLARDLSHRIGVPLLHGPTIT